MSDYLLRWYTADGGDTYEEPKDEADALARVVQLHSDGMRALLYDLVPVKLNVSARIIKRRKATPAPVQEATPPPPLGAGGSTEEQLYKKDVPECLMEGCREPGEVGEMCQAHCVGGLSDKSKAKLRARKAAERSAAGPLNEPASPEGKR